MRVPPRSAQRALIVLNVVLLASIVLIAVARPAGAQASNPPGARARGDYALVAGRSNSGGPSVVYVIDANNQEMVALRWDQSNRQMTGVGFRSIAGDAKVNPGR